MTSLCKNQFSLTKATKEAVSDKALDNVFEHLDNLLEEPSDTRQIDDPEIIVFINDQVGAFEKIANNLKVPINIDVFKHLIENIYINLLKEEQSGQLKQFGGAPKLLLNQGPTKQRSSLPILSIFAAFVFLLISVSMLYTAFHQLNVLTTRLTGESVIEYQRAAFKNVFTNVEELTLLQYMWKSISTLGCNMYGIQSNHLTNILITKLQQAIPDFATTARENCVMPPATGLLAFTEPLNRILTSSTVANCEMQTIQILGKQFLAQQLVEIDLITAQTMSVLSSIERLTRIGVGTFLAPSVIFLWKLGSSRSSKRMLNSGNRFEALEPGDERYLGRGGRKTRRNKKTKRTKSKRKATRRM
jgi:hypothetical protein